MAEFTVDSTTYALVGEPTVAVLDLRSYRRRASGKMSTQTRGPNSTVRVWQRLETDTLTDAGAAALQATLQAAGTVALAGDLIGSTVTCRAESIRRRDGPLADEARVIFDAIEVTPS